MSVQIPLTQNQFAIVCACHAHLVEGHKWCAQWMPTARSFYAVRNASVAERLLGAPAKILMHAVINGTPKGMLTDHQDGNTLNNRCGNLRTVTHSQNAMNKGKQSNNASGLKGVSWYKQSRKWVAYIGINGTNKYLGHFATPEQAARAYDEAAKELHGAHAILNFPEKSYETNDGGGEGYANVGQIECFICDALFVPTAAQKKMLLEGAERFNPDDWMCPECERRAFESETQED